MQVASALHLPFAYAQPTPGGPDTGLFPVRYPIPAPLHAQLRGKRVAVVNDVINAGSAVRGTLLALEECGAEPIAIGTLAVYGEAAAALAASHGAALETLASFPSEIWVPGSCPLCADGVALSEVTGTLA